MSPEPRCLSKTPEGISSTINDRVLHTDIFLIVYNFFLFYAYNFLVGISSVTGDDVLPGDALKLLGEDDLRMMTQLVNNIYETGEWPKGFTEITMIALKPKATKYSDNHTISLTAHTAKLAASIIRRRIERKTET